MTAAGGGREKARYSYTAADRFPAKLAQNGLVVDSVRRGHIPPVHVQLSPTNRCTRACSFCSCSAREKGLELPADDIVRIMWQFEGLGCRAVTVTGGGEPLLHPDIDEVVRELRHRMGLEIGLVTNGDLVGAVPRQMWHHVAWCRISCSDDVPFSPEWWGGIEPVVGEARNVDWAFSYVVTRGHDPENLVAYVRKAEESGFTHVRVVSDILDFGNVPDADRCNEAPLVIRQQRNHPRRGARRCLISLLKPVLAADGLLYPCCGTQYAEPVPSRDFSPSMCMGEDIPAIWREQRAFDGSVCDRCYYTDYNEFLALLQVPVTHKAFV